MFSVHVYTFVHKSSSKLSLCALTQVLFYTKAGPDDLPKSLPTSDVLLFYEDELLLVQCLWCRLKVKTCIPGLGVGRMVSRLALLCT